MSKDPQSTYYDAGGIETLDIIKAKLTLEQYEGYLLGNVIKYATRMMHKGCKERDAQKCATYANQLDKLLNGFVGMDKASGDDKTAVSVLSDDGWIENTGVAPSFKKVDVVLMNGTKLTNLRHNFTFALSGMASQIVKYRESK